MSQTVSAQNELEEDCLPLLADPRTASLDSLREKHAAVLRQLLGLAAPLPRSFSTLDASHPWIVFWSVNALDLLGMPLSPLELDRVGSTLIGYQHKNGGFGGGVGQPGHMAATYAAVMALAHTGPQFWGQINRHAMLEWMLSLKTTEGSIRVCQHGEADPRATYCALAVAQLLRIAVPELLEGVGPYLSRCQTYEGGFANEPFGEAHGGYAFCSLASLMLLSTEQPRQTTAAFCRITDLRRWLVARQDLLVPGFSGRTNKLVDGCYSHWVGTCWPLVSQCPTGLSSEATDLYNRRGLQDYIVKCCQSPGGGLRDKPGLRPDAYHSNYALCGLAVAQYRYKLGRTALDWKAERVFDAENNIVPPIHPLLGIRIPLVESVREWAASQPEVCLSPSSQRTSGGSPSSREYQGFALYVGATLCVASYFVWALLPASWLHAMRIDYYPSRWWAVATPAYVLVLMLFTYVALALFNTEKLTYPPTRAETICDKNSKVHDMPLFEANKHMYATKKL